VNKNKIKVAMSLGLHNVNSNHHTGGRETTPGQKLDKELDMFQSQGRDRLALVKEMASMTFLGSRIKKRDSPEYLFLMTQESRWPNVREVILVLGKALIREFPVTKDLQLMHRFKT
jgi:hypothetical protein